MNDQAAKISTQAAARRPALARVSARDTFAVWRRHGEVFLRLWKMELAAPLIEPVFTVLGFGLGLGTLIVSNVEGLSYLSFVGAGILSFTAMSRGVFECSYGSYFRMVYQSTFDAILATPVEVESLALAEIMWATTKSVVDAFIILVVLVLFGAATSPLAIFAPLSLMLGAFFASAVSLGVTAHIHDIDSYNLYLNIYFAVIFICGVWFPVELLPVALQWLAWALPVTHAIDLTRALLTGTLRARHSLELLYLLFSSFFALEWAMRSLRRRMVG